MDSLPRACTRRRVGRQLGLSLVEFMVSMAISMVLVLAAASIYLATRESQRSIDQASTAHEAGAYALRLIGRDLVSAGFYPAVRPASADLINVLPAYANITGKSAYEFGIFGCDGARLDPISRTCGAAMLPLFFTFATMVLALPTQGTLNHAGSAWLRVLRTSMSGLCHCRSGPAGHGRIDGSGFESTPYRHNSWSSSVRRGQFSPTSRVRR